ncbi:putative nucleotidyltransferase, Ribonuclease H [Helianthus annuus]|nr:putative nucleotidyltransferase, Ribonuclease H [Helianthus annuus]
MIVTKVKNAGYYWPGMHDSAVKELQQCDECQKHAPVSLRAKNEMIPVTVAWPFQKWGVDIVGPFPRSSGSAQYLLVVVDYFTKWVEARPFTVISGYNVTRFFWEQIVCRFGLPLYIVSDNAKQFAENPFKRWCENLKINQVFSSVSRPQGNGQVEQINRRIVDGIKRRLGDKGKGWADELPNVLWAHQTLHKTSNRETLFSLTYGTEAVIPAEIGFPNQRCRNWKRTNRSSDPTLIYWKSVGTLPRLKKHGTKRRSKNTITPVPSFISLRSETLCSEAMTQVASKLLGS